MIKRVWVKNYRSLAEVSVDLEPITVLVGPNGAGKSNFVDVLRFVYDACRLGLDAAIVNRNGMSALRRWSAKGRPYDVEIGLSIEVNESQATYSFTLGSERRGEYRVKRESCYVKTPDASALYETSNGTWIQRPTDVTPALNDRSLVLQLIASVTPFDFLYDYLTSFAFYNILPGALAIPQKPANPYPLDREGSNLASTLREMQRSRHPLLNELKEAIQAVLPDVIDFQVGQVGGFFVTRLRHQMAGDERAMFDLSQESDGTLRILGILVALYQGSRRTLLTLEEPELTIHPGILQSLWEEIEKTADRSQVIITTHSPDLLDLCRAEQLRVVEKRAGTTRIGPVDEDQREAIQKRLFAPGELLRAEGLRLAQIPMSL